MKKIIFLFVSSFLFISCVSSTYKPIAYYDSFTNSQITEFPSTYSSEYGNDYGFRTSFKMINTSNTFKNAYAYFSYEGSDWLFIDSIWMKISGDTDYMTLQGKFNREVIYGGRVSEQLTLKVDNELINFMKKSRGKTVIVRLNGDTKYREIRFPIGLPGEGGQWDMFLTKYIDLDYGDN